MGGERYGRIRFPHGQRPLSRLFRRRHGCGPVSVVVGPEHVGVVDVPGRERGGRRVRRAVHARGRSRRLWGHNLRQFPRPGEWTGHVVWGVGGRVCHSFSRRWRRPVGGHVVWDQQLRPSLFRPNRQHQPSLHLRPKHRHQDHHARDLRRESTGRAIRRVFHARVGRSVVAHPHRRPRQRGRCGHQPDGVFDQRLRRNLPQRMGRLSQQRESLHLRFWDNRHAGHRRRVPVGNEQRRLLVGGDESRRNGFAIRHVFWWRRVVRARGWGNLAV